jgi:hypothetical protein
MARTGRFAHPCVATSLLEVDQGIQVAAFGPFAANIGAEDSDLPDRIAARNSGSIRRNSPMISASVRITGRFRFS